MLLMYIYFDCHFLWIRQVTTQTTSINVTSDHDVQEKSIIMRGSVILLVAALNLNFTAVAILR